MGAHSVSLARRDARWILARAWHVFKIATFVAGVLMYLLLIAVFA